VRSGRPHQARTCSRPPLSDERCAASITASDNARRFMGLPLANPDPEAVKPPALAHV